MSIRRGSTIISGGLPEQSGTPDLVTTRANTDNETEVIGIYTTQNEARKIWEGTLAEYNAISEKDPNCYYYITDDGSGISEIAGGGNLFIATKGTTTYAEMLSEYNLGHTIVLKEDLEDNTVRYFNLDVYNANNNFFDFKSFIANSPTGLQQVTGWQVNQNNIWTPVTMNLAKLDSPAFTGTPTAPTAAAGTSTTQIATTAFVQAAIQSALGEVEADMANLYNGGGAE